MDHEQLFGQMFSGFFQEPGIAGQPEDRVFAELAMDLRRETPRLTAFVRPDGLVFDVYRGEPLALADAVSRVDEGWTKYFDGSEPAFCALDRGRIAAFCLLSDWGSHGGIHVGGPGCVGTVPEYRRKGIGLELVRQATCLLKEQGFDISWIHYTHLERWYQKLGYRTVLQWNRNGILSARG